MKEIHLSEWMNEQENIERAKEIKNHFNISCVKCGSKHYIIESSNDIGTGSEYTGLYGDAGAIIKCLDCGNAVRLVTISY